MSAVALAATVITAGYFLWSAYTERDFLVASKEEKEEWLAERKEEMKKARDAEKSGQSNKSRNTRRSISRGRGRARK